MYLKGESFQLKKIFTWKHFKSSVKQKKKKKEAKTKNVTQLIFQLGERFDLTLFQQNQGQVRVRHRSLVILFEVFSFVFVERFQNCTGSR